MKHARWLAPLVMLLAAVPEAPAQVLVAPFVPGYGVAPGIGFSYRGRHLGVSGFLAPPVYGYGYGYRPWGYPYFGYPTTSITYIYSPPPQIVMTPPIIINNNNNQTVVVGPGIDVDREDDGRFLKIIPRQRRPADDAPPANGNGKRPAEPPVRKEAVAPKKPEPKPAPRPRKEEKGDLVEQGKEAFAGQQYGLAERRFQRAVDGKPADPLPYFLLAEAQFALGKYREAVNTIHAGMREHPGWPTERFELKDLYGDADDLDEHLKRLDETLARNPNDAAVLFLQGHQFWFLGKQAEARLLFQRAIRAGGDRMFIDRFLKARPDPVARK